MLVLMTEWEEKKARSIERAKAHAKHAGHAFWSWWDNKKRRFEVTKGLPFWGTSATKVEP